MALLDMNTVVDYCLQNFRDYCFQNFTLENLLTWFRLLTEFTENNVTHSLAIVSSVFSLPLSPPSHPHSASTQHTRTDKFAKTVVV